MILYASNESYKLYHGTMMDMLNDIEPNSVSSVVTDPPYELNFMGKGWDNSGIAFQKETWQKCFEVLKPGGYLLAFGGSRTFHRIACAIEDGGFEIRDVIMWLYGSGFPKSMDLAKSVEAKLTTGSANPTEFKNLNGERADRGTLGFSTMQHRQGARPNDYGKLEVDRLGKLDATTEEARQWNGWGTALKPAYEPIIVARKPLDGTCTDNVLKWGVGGLNIEECKVGEDTRVQLSGRAMSQSTVYSEFNQENAHYEEVQGRFPSNMILTYDDTDFNELCGCSPEYGRLQGNIGSALRYFYCAKASKRDRDEGLDNFRTQTKVFNGTSDQSSEDMKDVEKRFTTEGKNVHPTVKPVQLMQYLVRLVTPKGGTVLDPFNGSGSTGKAVMYENNDRDAKYKYIGIELTEQYLPISKARIEYAQGDKTSITVAKQTKGRLF